MTGSRPRILGLETTGVCLLLLTSTAGWLGAPAPAAAGLTDLADRIDAPSLGLEVKVPEAIRLHGGVLTPNSGARAFQLLADGEPCGLYLKGRARFDYTVHDRYSREVARRNIRRASTLDVHDAGEELRVTEELTGAVLWSWALGQAPAVDSDTTAAPQATGHGGEGPDVPLQYETTVTALPDWVGKLLKDPLNFDRPSLDMVTARHMTTPGTLYALLKGNHHSLLWRIDPIEDLTEELWRFDKPTTNNTLVQGRFFRQRLATQPLERNWWDRAPATLVAVDELISVDNPLDERVVISTTTRLRSTMNGVKAWRVSLFDEIAFRGRRRKIEITSVSADGESADYLHRDNNLVIELPRALDKDETVEIKVVNEGDLAIRPAGDNFWSLGTAPWYPQPALNGELATIAIRLRVPSKYTPFASGEVVFRRDEGEFSIVETRLDKPMQFPVVAAGNYKLYSETKNGITCNVATYGTGKERAAKRLINNFFGAADFYGKLFGIPYPFKEFTIIERNTWGFGQAPPGIIFITKEAFDSIGDETSQAFSGGINERYVHEIAHAWWGHVVKMDSFEEQWLTESFASYSSALCLQAVYGGKRGKREFNMLMRRWEGGMNELGKGASIYLANYLAGEGIADNAARRILLYEKGPVVLHALRQQLARDLGGQEAGDRYFFALLKSFLKNFEFNWGGTRHLVGILNQITKKDWQPWFEKYVYGTEIPKVDL